jgi:hypothetical protein
VLVLASSAIYTSSSNSTNLESPLILCKQDTWQLIRSPIPPTNDHYKNSDFSTGVESCWPQFFRKWPYSRRPQCFPCQVWCHEEKTWDFTTGTTQFGLSTLKLILLWCKPCKRTHNGFYWMRQFDHTRDHWGLQKTLPVQRRHVHTHSHCASLPATRHHHGQINTHGVH